MKSFFKFIGLTVITCGLYIPYRILRRIFGGSKKKGGKLPKDWKFAGHIMLAPENVIGLTTKEIKGSLAKLLPDISSREVDILYDQLVRYNRCRFGASRSEILSYLNHTVNDSPFMIVSRNQVGCCGGSYEDGDCDCGIQGVAKDIKDRGILNAEEVWTSTHIG